MVLWQMFCPAAAGLVPHVTGSDPLPAPDSAEYSGTGDK
jgi:hypothetical protein